MLDPAMSTVAENPIGIDDLESPLFIAWQITSLCNMRCHHCCEDSAHLMPNEMNRSRVLDLCRQIADMSIPYVAVSGGEPMLHPQFFDVCRFFRSQGIALKVETNGELVTEEATREMARLGLRSVQISVDGATAATHEQLRLKGRWQDAIDACRRLVAAGVRTEIVFVPTKFNIHETAAVIDLASSLGVYGIYTGKLMRIGRAAKNWQALCPSDAQYEEFFRVLRQKTHQYLGRMKVYYYPYDVIEELRVRVQSPSASLLVIPDGRVKLIGPLPFICGHLAKHSLREIWDRYRKAWRLPQVRDFVAQVLAEPSLVSRANDWIELY
jgi:MoaA/NifB/PqqE/SkfB family radical SAM enzyme